MRNTNLSSLQYARAIAALMVMYYHTGVNFAPAYWPPAINRDYGSAGVAIFFVISGFIMVLSTSQSSVSPMSFFTRRLIRIVPLYWVFTLLAFGVGLLVPSMMLENRTDADHLLQSLVFWPHENPVSHSIAPFFKIGWTLVYEMYFYVFFALLLFISAWRMRVGILVGATVSLFTAGLFFENKSVVADFITSEYWLLFSAGALIASCDLAGKLARVSAFQGFVLAGAALLWLLLEPRGAFDPTEKIAAAMFVAGLLVIDRQAKMPGIAWLGYMGTISYSLYLAHDPLFTVCRFVANRLALPVGSSVWGPIAIGLAIAAAIVASMVVHHAIDVPLRRKLSAMLAGRQSRPRESVDATTCAPV